MTSARGGAAGRWSADKKGSVIQSWQLKAAQPAEAASPHPWVLVPPPPPDPVGLQEPPASPFWCAVAPARDLDLDDSWN